ncbi:MAG: FliM/FliN family flagellar motor switch protein, partial [Chlamydiia bacterium]|nr:FliM/FliN family flagellar motor switch protein [Chlamydiia bacterium]
EDVNIGFLLELSETFYADWNSKNSKKSLANIFENNEIADQIILDLSVIVGGAVLTKMDFIHLSEGDCILLNWGNWPSIKGIASLEMNDMPFLNAEIYGKTIKLGEFIMPEEKKNDIVAKGKQDVLKDNVKSITVTAEDILDNMDVIVKAEIASFKKNIKEVASLSSGNILPLETDGTIFLKVDGKIFAKGKMVRLGDSFGVQIISKSS